MSTKIKICGLVRHIDIDYANAVRPDYIGFVFAPSRRRVTAETAAALRRRLDGGIIPVGVFVNAEPEEIIRLFGDGVIAIAQLHGGESAAYIEAIKERDIPVIQAIRAGHGDLACASTDFLLLDSGKGGSGETFDWHRISPSEKPFFLAGGIDASNIKEALSLSPYGIDVSSGAEADGVKDLDKMIGLVKACRSN